MSLSLGFIGLGIMGRPMARHLLAAGYRVTVWNRSRPGIDALVAASAVAADGPAQVAEVSDIVITMVGDSNDVEQVVLGEQGVLAGAHRGLILIDMSTISPEVTRKIAAACAAKGVDMLDAPVSGGERGAVEGTLSIMVGGKREVVERCMPILRLLGNSIEHVGDHGMGQTVKLCNQVICGLNILAVAEGLTLAAKAGAEPAQVVRIVSKGAAGSWMVSNLVPKMVEGDYAPGFMIKLQMKDLRLALEAAANMEVPLPGTAIAQQMFQTAAADGAAEEGTQALVKALEKLANTRVAR